jgi:hypothetical protein
MIENNPETAGRRRDPSLFWARWLPEDAVHGADRLSKLVSDADSTFSREKRRRALARRFSVHQPALKNLELLLDLAVEEPLDRVRSVSIVTLIGAVADEGQWRVGVSEVLDTKREGRIVQQASPSPTMTFGCGRDGLFADELLTFFVVAGFRRFRSDLNGRPEFIGDLIVERSPAAD